MRSFCLRVSIRICAATRIVLELLRTFEIACAIMSAIVLATRGIVPFHAEPLALLVFDRANEADGAGLGFQAEALADVVIIGSHAFLSSSPERLSTVHRESLG